MRRGDIILVNYRFDPISWYIKKITKSEWNHTAFVIDNERVVESRGKGIVIGSIKRYKNKSFFKMKVVRPKLDCKKLNKAIDYAIMQVGNESTYFKFLYTLFSLKHRYFIKSSHKTCSGMIAEVLNIVGFQFRNDKKPLQITPEDINSSEGVDNVEE